MGYNDIWPEPMTKMDIWKDGMPAIFSEKEIRYIKNKEKYWENSTISDEMTQDISHYIETNFENLGEMVPVTHDYSVNDEPGQEPRKEFEVLNNRVRTDQLQQNILPPE